MSGGGFESRLEGPLWDARGGAALVARLRTAMFATLARVERDAVADTPVNTGALRASIATRIEEEGGTGPLGLPVRLAGYIGSPLEYAAPVEFGTLPHWPPAEPIEAWVRRKLVAAIDALVQAALPRGRQRKAGAQAPRFASQVRPVDLRERAVRSLAFLVRRKIANWGTPNARMIRNAIEGNRTFAFAAFRAALAGFGRDV